MLKAFGALVSAVAGVTLVFHGIDVFDCQSVSFSSRLTTCFPNTDFGLMSGAVAGIGLVLVGAVLFYFALISLAKVR